MEDKQVQMEDKLVQREDKQAQKKDRNSLAGQREDKQVRMEDKLPLGMEAELPIQSPGESAQIGLFRLQLWGHSCSS